MLRRTGQVAARLARFAAEVVLGLMVLTVLAGLVLAWRLSVGPLDLTYFAPRIAAVLDREAGGPQVKIGAAALAWEGFRHGLESPVVLVLADVLVQSADHAGSAMIPRAEVSLATLELLGGRIVPRRILIDQPRLSIVRSKEGGIAMAFGSGTAGAPSVATANLAGEIVTALAAPPGNVRRAPAGSFAALSQLQRLAIHGAELTVVDQALGATWHAPVANLSLTRGPLGGVNGDANIELALDGRHAELSLQATLASADHLGIEATLSPINPATLAAAMPELAPLAALDAPVRLSASFDLGAGFALRRFGLEGEAEAGHVSIAGGTIPIAHAAIEVEGDAAKLSVRQAVLRLVGPNGGAGPELSGTGAAIRDAAGTWQGDVSLRVDTVPMGDLARYWPPGIARGGRDWVTENITAGTARNGTVALGFTLAPDMHDLRLDRIAATVAATGLVVHWLRPIPPLVNGEATLSISELDALTIHVKRATEGKLVVEGGEVRITGLEEHDQDATISGHITGPLGDAVALLAEPRLHLLSKHPLPLSDASGSMNETFSVALPLLKNVSMDEVRVHTSAQLNGVRVGGLVDGHGLEEGALTLAADNDGMKLSGNARIGGIPARFSYAMDFRAGPPSQVLQRISAEARVDANDLSRFGWTAANEVLEGPIALSGDLEKRRDGRGTLHVRADFADASVHIAALGFTKPPGASALGTATLSLAGEQITGVDAFNVNGPSIGLAGSASFAGGVPTMLTFSEARLGRSEAAGSVRFGSAGQPMRIELSGSVADLSGQFTRGPRGGAKNTASNAPASGQAKRGPPWVLDARFARALLAEDRALSDAVLHAVSNGERITEARLGATLGPGKPLTLSITPGANGRALSLSADDAGALLAGIDVTNRVVGGTLSMSAQYDDATAGSPLAGTTEIKDFRVHNAPALGRILQAMTLYGVVQLLEGPGLGFSDLIAPFRLTGQTLDLMDARAFSPSLGMTAKGSIDLAADTVALSGTIVPAYFFNSLLGRIPIIGRIFSPEKGSGLFAATYSVNGPLSDPKVGVNPLAALTPGFLRGLFSIFD